MYLMLIFVIIVITSLIIITYKGGEIRVKRRAKNIENR
jgi:hypothetical protein